MSKLTYGDFFETGRQDCENVLEMTDFIDNVIATDLSYPSNVAAEKIFDRSWNKDEDDIRSHWMRQADTDEIEEDDLDIDRCFSEWAKGWRECAIHQIETFLKEHREAITERLARKAKRQRDSMHGVVYWIGDDDGVESTELNTFEAALEEIATQLARTTSLDALSIYFGDFDGPHETLARVERLDVSENHEARAAGAELVLTIDALHHIPTQLIDAARTSHVVTLEYGPGRGYRRERDRSIVYVQLAGDLEHDSTAMRMAALEFNPAKIRGLTAKGNKMYSHVLAAIGMRAEAQKRGAPRAAVKTVVSAAKHGVPGLVRKNPVDNPVRGERNKIIAGMADRLAEEGDSDPQAHARELAESYESFNHAKLDQIRAKFMKAQHGDLVMREYPPHSFGAILVVIATNDSYRKSWGDALKGLSIPMFDVMRKNPNSDAEFVSHALKDAEARYKTFHRYDPKDIGEFPSSFSIPAKMRKVGDAVFTTYRSGKVDPATLKLPRKPVNYIHHHDAGVEVYVPTSDREFGTTDDPIVSVPTQFRDAGALVKLGDSLGFCVRCDDDELECEHESPLPELYCTTDGKCLLIIEGKREVKAMIWGGALGVFARGIDG